MINDAVTFQFRRLDEPRLTLPAAFIGGVTSTFTRMAEELAATGGYEVRIELELLSAQQGSLTTMWIATVEWLNERRTSPGEVATLIALPLAALQMLNSGSSASAVPTTPEPSYERALAIVERAEARVTAKEWATSLQNAIEICRVDEVLIVVPDSPGRVVRGSNYLGRKMSEYLRVEPDQIGDLIRDLRRIDAICDVVVLNDRTVRYFVPHPDSDLNNFLMQIEDIKKAYQVTASRDERDIIF
ncbi:MULTISPECIES: hypothetical protein [unclassified Sphingomonas]|uniref:hypothetical protein n=1 Tax=unclassified Sphingomonas TaxID=196159 RepID=UPI002151EDD4|nr:MULTISPECIES: hypothetical protein [unclassified Sphingomonas]MCR5870753.1 hypothetical protein [Sphingomonas sp. J344]UUY00915.1 hypothetical protein LRS08_07610 [Sphingomonas sp. J315]